MQKKSFSFLGYTILLATISLSTMAFQNLEAKSLKKEYQFYCNTSSDINRHIPYLSALASECTTVAEIGGRTLIPGWGILKGLSENKSPNREYLVIDSEYPAKERLETAERLAKQHGIHFAFWHVNDMHIDLESTDMLLLGHSGHHTYCHLTYQLETFAPRIRKYICIHHTASPWENRNDPEYRGDYEEYPASYHRNKQGLWPAIVDFLENHPEWELFQHRKKSQGLTVLKRKDTSAVRPRFHDSEVEHYLRNKIILCTGPSLRRYNQLKQITEADMKLVRFKKIFLSTNDPNIMSITFNGVKPVTEYIDERDKAIDCLNCIFTTLKNAVNDPEVQNDDIILFKHESVFINDMNLFKKAIRKMLDGADMVARNTYWGIGTGEFFVKVSAIREIVKDYPIITELPTDEFAKTNNVWNAETYFTTYLVRHIKNPYIMELAHSHWKFTQLGLYHITLNPGQNGPADNWGNYWWDKKDYDALYQ